MVTGSSSQACIYCGHDQHILMAAKEDFRFLLHGGDQASEWAVVPLVVGCCRRCGLVTLRDPPPRALLDQIYGENYQSYPSFAPSEQRAALADEFLATFSKFPARGSTLEIGSYDGLLLKELKRRGFKVMGCDPNASAAAHAERAYGVATLPAYFAASLFASERFDLVICRLLLEHVSNPGEIWSDISRVLAPGGKLAVEVPNCLDLIEAGMVFFMIEHITYFTPASLRRVLEAAGFELDEMRVAPLFLRALATKRHEISEFEVERLKREMDEDMRRAQAYAGRLRENMDAVRRLTQRTREGGGGLAVYGAGHFFEALLNFAGLDGADIAMVCDGNPAKWGWRISGIGLPVQSPDRISFPEVALVVVATQSHASVLGRLRNYLQSGGQALVFRPGPMLVREPTNG